MAFETIFRNGEKILHASDPNWIIKEVNTDDNYGLLITFITGEKKRFDCTPLLEKEIYAPLKNKGLFKQAKKYGSNVAWSDEIDIGPEYLYENSVTI